MKYIKIVFVLLCTYNVPKIYGIEAEWRPVSEMDWQLQNEFAEGHDAIMLIEKIIADDRRLTESKCYLTLYRRIKINSNEARKWANVTAPIIHKKQKIKRVDGRTTLQTGEQFYLTESQILEKNIFKSNDLEIDRLSFAMPGVSDNSIIEYTIEYELPQPNRQWLFQKELPLVYGEYHWLVYQFQLKNYFNFQNYFDNFSSDNRHDGRGASVFNKGKTSEPMPAIPIMSKLIPDYVWLQDDQDIQTEFIPSQKEPEEIIFVVKNVPAFEPEPYSLPETSLKHQVRCYYLDGDPKTYWKAVAKNTMDYIKTFVGGKNRLQRITSQFKLLNSPDEKASACYQWLQDNIKTVSSGTGCNTNTRTTVDDILQRKYGTVAEINHVFYLMLKDLGIDAYMAYTANRANSIFYPAVKQLAFDVNLVAVPNRENNYRFFAPGERFLPETHVPWYAEGATAFLVNDHSYGFHNIPFSSPKLNSIQRITWLSVDKHLNFKGEIYQKHLGHQARQYQLNPEHCTTSFFAELLQNELNENIPELMIRSTHIKSNEPENAKISYISKINFPMIQNHIPPRLFLRPADFMLKVENPFHRQHRTQSIVFDYAYDLTDVLHFQLPSGWELEALPKDFEFKNNIGSCEVAFFMTGNTLSVQRKFRLNKPVWEAGDYEKICDLFKNQQMSTLLTAVLRVDESTTLSLRD